MNLTLFVLACLGCFASFYGVVRALPTRSLPVAMATASAVIGAQLILAAQALSLAHALRPVPYALAHLAAGACSLLWARNRPFKVSRQLTEFAKTGTSSRWLIGISAYALSALGVAFLAALWLNPYGDTYHFSRACYWVQHGSMLPFPVANSRINSFAQGTEAILLPGFLYLATLKSNVVVTMACLLALPVLTFELGRWMGFGPRRAYLAALLSLGFTPTWLSMSTGSADILLPAVWVATSFLLLFEASGPETLQPARGTLLAASIFCYAMAAGLKNVALLGLPAYLVVFVAHGGKAIWRPGPLLRLVAIGLLGVVASGAAWNYGANWVFYRNLKGSEKAVEEHMASMDLASVWTRILRGTTYLWDLTYLPQPARDLQGKVFAEYLRLAGARQTLEGESEESFFRYLPNKAAVRRGLGPLGILFVVACFLEAAASFKRRSSFDHQMARRLSGLGFFAFGFLVVHAVVRWATIGRVRFMPPFLSVSGPLLARILVNRWLAGFCVLLFIANTAYLTGGSVALALRRSPGEATGWRKKIEGFARERSETVGVTLSSGERRDLRLKESFDPKEVYLDLLGELPAGSHLGFVGGFNSAELYLFGPGFRNQLVPLVEGDPALADKLGSVEYVVFEGEAGAFGHIHLGPADWSLFYRAESEHRIWLEVHRRQSAASAGSRPPGTFDQVTPR